VARFLSPGWVEEFNTALDGVVLPDPGPDAGLVASEGRFTVAQDVRATPDGDVRLIMRIDAGSIHLGLDSVDHDGGDRDRPAGSNSEAPEPDVTISLTYVDAAALSKGEFSPAEALNAGRVRVRGDLSVLVTAQQMFHAARVGARGLESSTTY
jgi:SCP-2 sterol transfer family